MKLYLHRIFILLFCLISINVYSQSLGNNTCATAVTVPTTGVCVTGNNNTATSTGDGTASCFTVENGVWFKFVAPASGVVDITTSDVTTNFDSQLTLYSGTCGALTEMDCDDQGGTIANSALIHAECLTPGQTYYVMLDGYAGDIGTFCIKITTVLNPINDFCTCATTLPLNGTCLTNQTTIGATDGWTGIVGCQSGNNPEVWYTFVADSSSVTFSVTAGTMGGNVEMILGEAPNCSSTFTTIGSYCAPSVSSHTFLNLTIGATYYLTISSSGAAGTFTICGLSSTPIPLPGQDCSSAAELCTNASFGQATSSAGFGIQEVNTANSCWGSGGERQSRWYKFTVGASGTLGFVIDPVVNTDDYDWAIWDITTAGCPSTLSATPDAIACNWWGTMPPTTDVEGSTGISLFTTAAAVCASQPGAVDNDAGTGGCQPYSFLTNYPTIAYGPLTVQAGHTYAILIDNFSISNNGFNFSFGGTAHIGPVADFVTLKSCTSATLAGGPATSNTTYNWNFGDGSTSTTTYSVAHTYTAAGTYSTSLLTTDALGCTASSNDVVDLGNPTLVISPLDTICSGATAQLLSTATPNSPQLTFSNNTATAIPNNNATGINSTIAVSGITPSTISGNQMVKVCLDIAHATDDNLDITLTCPSGNTVILTSDNGGSGANYSNTCFTGIIATPIDANITPANAPFSSGYYNAETNLSALNSCNINGTWTLNVSDDAGGSSGTLNSWNITFNTTSNTVAYAWTPTVSLSASNISNPVASPTTTTIYTVTATDGQGCATTATTQVFVKPLPVPSITSSNTLCLGSSLTFTGSGASTYTWTTGASGGLSSSTGSTVSATPTATGNITYTATVTGTNSCSNSTTKTVTVNPIPTANASVSSTLTCSNSTIGLTGSGGGTYAWSGSGITSGSATATPSVNAPGTYSLTVTSAAGCVSTMTTVTVTQNITVPSVSSAVSNTLTCTNTTVNASATTTTTPVSYSWSGTGITSAANISTITVNQPGTFNYTVTNTTNGCITTGSQAVTQNTAAPTVAGANTGSLNCTVLSVNASATTTTTPVSYNWSGTGITSAANISTITVNQPGTFNYTVTNTSNGCVTTGSQAITQNTASPTVAGANTGSLNCTVLSVNASATTSTTPVSYNWSGTGITSAANISTITVNQPGTFNYTVTNTSNGCITTGSQAITQNTTAPTVAGANTGSLNCTVLSVNASATTTTTPVSYNWSGTGITSAANISTITVNQGGTFTYTVTNTTNNCKTINTVAVVQNTTAPTVAGANTGSLNCTVLSVNASATTTTTPVSYNWSGTGITSAANISTITVNQGGTFTYTVTNTANNCTTINTVAVVQNTTAPTVTGANTGSLNCTVLNVNASATTTTTPVSYNWSGSGITSAANISTITVNQGGTFTYTVTNTANNCTTINTVAVVQNTTAPTVTGANTGSLNCTVLSVNASATTTTTPVSYNWSGTGITSAANISTITVNQGGTFTYTVTNTANNCTTINTVTVVQNTTAPTVTGANTGSLNCTVLNVNASATTTTTPVSYNWSGTGITSAANISTITVNQPGTFSYTVTNTTNGCITTGSQAITQNTTAPSIMMPGTQTITCVTPTVSLTGSANPSTCTPVWTGGVSSGANSYTATASSATIYTLTVTNPFNNCANSGTVQVSPSAGFPSVNSSMTNSITCSLTTAQVIASTTTSPVSYSWSGPGSITSPTSSTTTVNAGGTYTCVVTNTLSACSSTTTIFVPTNTTAVTASIAPTSSINCLVTSQVLTASPTGSYSYSWTPNAGLTGNTVSTPTVSTGGTYSVVITNTINGCVGTSSIAVVSNTVIPTVTISPSSFTTTCATPTVQLTANTSTNSVSYSWSSPATGTLTSNNTANPIANGAGVFTVVVTNTVNGCISSPSTSSITIDVVVPTATLSTNSLSITCTNPSPGTSVTTSTSSVSYSWTPSSGIASGATTANPTFTAAGTYSAIITNTVNGCTSNVSANSVTVTLDNTIPTLTISPSQTLTCTTPSIVVSTTVIPNTGIVYTWNGNGVTGATTNTVDVNQPGVYSTTVTNPVNGCSATTNVSITSNTISPIATVAVNSITTTCAAPTATLNASSTPSTGVSYNWTAPASGSLNTFTVSNPVAGGSGIFTVTVTDNTNGCSTTVSQATVEIIPDAATPVINVSANSLTITCTNTTVTTALTSTNTISSYNWNPVPATGGANPVFDTPGIYNATVTASNGCPTNVSVDVDIDITVPTVTLTSATNDGTLTCLTTSITITPTISTSSNLTYTWSPSVGLSSNANQASATFTAAGIYTLAITNTVTGCVTSLTNTANTFSVTEDNLAPTFTLGTAPSVTTTCAAPNATLSGTSNADPNSVYTWTTPTSSTLTGNPIVNSTPGTYSVTVTNTVNGCSTSASAQPTVEVVADSGIPNITLSANSVSITCSDPTPSVSITTAASPVSYSWSPTAGITPGTETTANPSFTAAGSYSVIVTNTVSGCATTISSNIVDVYLDNTVPVISLSSGINNDTITCQSSSVAVIPNIIPTSSNLTYTWSPSAGVSSPINQANATFTAAGVYTLAVTNTLTGCVSVIDAASTFTVSIDTIRPTANIVPISTNTIIGCGASNSTVTLDGSSSTSANPSPIFNWLPNNTSGSTLSVTTSATYTLVVLDAVSGCSNTSQYFVDGNTNPPQNVNAGSAVSIACGSSSVTLNGVTTSTNVNYSWSGPSATSILSGSNTTTPIVAETGTYTLTVTDNLTGCQSTATVNVSQSNVTAAFTADPTTGVSPLTVNFTDASTGANSWTWNFGDGTPSVTYTTNPLPLTNVYSTGSYTVILTAASGSCTSTASVVIVVEDGLTLEIPNVFTPNGDNANDVFTIHSTGVKEISLQIFNRWGQKLHEFTGPQASWDGLAPNGTKVPEGTYFLFIKATGFDGTEIEKNGTLNLFR